MSLHQNLGQDQTNGNPSMEPHKFFGLRFAKAVVRFDVAAPEDKCTGVHLDRIARPLQKACLPACRRRKLALGNSEPSTRLTLEKLRLNRNGSMEPPEAKSSGLIFANLALLAHSLRNYVLPAKTVSMSMSMCQCVSQNRHCAQLPGCPMGKKITCECHYSAESPGQHMVITGRNLPPINTNDKKSGKPNPETEAFVKFS